MTKTYDVTCPDKPFCGEDFLVEMDPATEVFTVECPHCGGEFDWEHNALTDTITLFKGDDEGDEEDESAEDEDDEEEDELS
jgi:transcription elongation factor Elf1